MTRYVVGDWKLTGGGGRGGWVSGPPCRRPPTQWEF